MWTEILSSLLRSIISWLWDIRGIKTAHWHISTLYSSTDHNRQTMTVGIRLWLTRQIFRENRIRIFPQSHWGHIVGINIQITDISHMQMLCCLMLQKRLYLQETEIYYLRSLINYMRLSSNRVFQFSEYDSGWRVLIVSLAARVNFCRRPEARLFSEALATANSISIPSDSAYAAL